MRLSIKLYRTQVLLCVVLAFSNLAVSQARTEREREKAVIRQQFSKNFHDLQVVSQELLQEHVSGQLTPSNLSKKAKAIHKSARALRTLMALGELAQEPHEFDRELTDAREFDQSIKLLAKMIYDFSHSPVHQNSKVFNTLEATKTQKDLLTIIALAKVIETQARKYNKLSGIEAYKDPATKPD